MMTGIVFNNFILKYVSVFHNNFKNIYSIIQRCNIYFTLLTCWINNFRSFYKKVIKLNPPYIV